MRKALVLLVLIGLLVVGSLAAPRINSPASGEIMKLQYQLNLARVLNFLDFTDDQLSALYELASSTRQELEALKTEVQTALTESLDKAIAGENVAPTTRADIQRRAASVLRGYFEGLKSIVTVGQVEKLAAQMRGATIDTPMAEERLSQLRENLKERLKKLPPEMQARLKQFGQTEKFENSRDNIQKRLAELKKFQPDIKSRKLPGTLNQSFKPVPQRLVLGLLSDEALEVLERMIAQ